MNKKRKVGTPNESGEIPAGESCAYSAECEFKMSACNNHGCPIRQGKRLDVPFSCGFARALKIIKGKKEKSSQTGREIMKSNETQEKKRLELASKFLDVA